MPKRRPKFTKNAPGKGQAVAGAVRRRKPRARDWVGAVIALTIVIAMIISAIYPFFIR